MSKSQLKPGWARVKFGDVVRLNTERCADPAAAGIERYVGLEHIDPEDLRLRRWGQVSEGITFTNLFRPGQVLFGKRRAYQRKVAVPDFGGVCSGDIYVFESKDSGRLLPDLLPFICQSEGFFEHAVSTSAGSLSPRTNWTQLAQYEFTLPPLDEQRRLANLLMTLYTASQEVKNIRISLENLRHAYIRDTFSKLMNRPDVKLLKVSDAGEVTMGRQLAPKYSLGISPRAYLRVANVFDGYIDTSDINEMDFSDGEYAKYKLEPGDILLNEGNSRELVGRSSLYNGQIADCCFQNTLIRFRPYKNVSPGFAQHYFQYCLYTGQFAAIAKQTTSIAHLGVNRFVEMNFPYPTSDDEREIVSELEQIEVGQKEIKRRQASVNRLKQSVLASRLSNL